MAFWTASDFGSRLAFMHDAGDRDPVQDAVRRTIEDNAPRVQDWMADQPGAWGFLAGKAVIAYRQALGRSPTDLERRRVWRLLWESLSALQRGS